MSYPPGFVTGTHFHGPSWSANACSRSCEAGAIMIDVEPGQGAPAQLLVRLPTAPLLTWWLRPDGFQFSERLRGLCRCPRGPSYLRENGRLGEPAGGSDFLRSSPNARRDCRHYPECRCGARNAGRTTMSQCAYRCLFSGCPPTNGLAPSGHEGMPIVPRSVPCRRQATLSRKHVMRSENPFVTSRLPLAAAVIRIEPVS
jgi:hypothetical protein